MMHDSPALRVSGLGKTYMEGGNRHTVFSDLALDLQQGQCVALLGPSGSGKSTLLNLLGGIDRPDTGWIDIGAQRISHLSERRRTLFRRRHIGFIFQFFNLIPTLTVQENLLLPLELNGLADGTRVTDLLDRVGLSHRGQSFPDALSGGEQQRVAICRALIHSPTLLLADEPTGNLDQATGERVLDLLLDLARQSRQTVLMVTHSRQVAQRCDRILHLQNGRLDDLAS